MGARSKADREAVEQPPDYQATHADLREWLAKQTFEQDTYTCYVYRKDPINRQLKYLVKTYHEEVPDEDTIGLTFGSGRYTVLVIIPETDQHERKITQAYYNIGKEYDEYRKAGGMPGAPPPGSSIPAGGSGGGPTGMVMGMPPSIDPTAMFTQSFALIKSVIEMIGPMMRPPDNGGSTAGVSDSSFSDILAANYKQMNRVFQEQALGQVRFMNDTMRQVSNLPPVGEDGTPDDRTPTILEQLLPLIENLVPKLLGHGPKAEATAGVVKTLPIFQEIAKNRQVLKALCVEVERKHGRESLDEILGKLGLKRP